eukprot:scaffold4731_cov175-Ochromonas_danica.AAC.19
MSDPLDEELLGLLDRLSKVQKVVGGGKKDHQQHTDSGGKVDRFINLYDIMTERLEKIKNAIDEIRKLERVPGSNPKDLISNQSLVRTELAAITEDWKELDIIFRMEKKKKRSRFSPEQLEARQQMVVNLQQSIQEIKDIQRGGYVKGYVAKRMATMEESELFRKPGGTDLESGGGGVNPMSPSKTADGKKTVTRSVIGTRNNNMTDEHRQALMLIRDRDAKIDEEIDEIGKGVDVLRELALAANEEVKIQNKMLDTLEEKVNDVHDKVSGINVRLKVTLEKVRASDKIFMDIFCVIILIGMVIVFYKLNSDAQKK